MENTLQDNVYNLLISTDGNLGRSGFFMKSLAGGAKISVSQLQSFVLGRRNLSDDAAKRVKKRLGQLERIVAKINP